MPDTFNKGEWSEFYAFVRVLADGQVYAADENLNRVDDIYYPVMGSLRTEDGEAKRYSLEENETVLITDKNSSVIKEISRKLLKDSVQSLFSQIKEGTGSSFEVPLAERLKEELVCSKIKADSQNKEDITLIVHDYVTSRNNTVGFSVKSNIGAAPTLLNASRATRFCYRVNGYLGDLSEVNEIDTKNKVRDRTAYVLAHGGALEFLNARSEVFTKNIRKIDSLMPVILSEMLLHYYQGHASSIEDLTRLTATSDNMRRTGLDYEDIKFKIKYLLLNIALGMMPAKLWDGFIKADGGYIVVKEDGELLCYHIYNIAQFSEYLFNNTKLETPSTTKHEYGHLYENEGALFFDLNIQIRFQ